MFTKKDVITTLLREKNTAPIQSTVKCFSPSNIALAKYWGKRDGELNLPQNSSLSISLKHRGSTAQLQVRPTQHELIINEKSVDLNSQHGQRLIHFLDLFRQKTQHFYRLQLEVNIPFAAGLASSACVFASIVLALDQLYEWQLPLESLSILARLGSGSAARSITSGFVEWQVGRESNGMDSFAIKIPITWPDLCIGLCIFHRSEKSISSREGMLRTVTTSPLYSSWPSYAESSVQQLKQALHKKDFSLLGKTAENNALTMHATMQSAWPPILYSSSETIMAMQQIWQLRQEGIPIYFTQDAGPNLKILTLKKYISNIEMQLKPTEWIQPFDEEKP